MRLVSNTLTETKLEVFLDKHLSRELIVPPCITRLSTAQDLTMPIAGKGDT
jgi:hypothetical protein